MRLAIQALAFEARRAAIGLPCLVAAGEFFENRAAAGGLRLAGSRLQGAADGEPLALAYLHSARAPEPAQHVRHISQHVHHLHLLQQFIHRLTLRVEQHGAPDRALRWQTRQPAVRERSVEVIRDARHDGKTRAGESAHRAAEAQRTAAMLRMLLRDEAPYSSARLSTYARDTAPGKSAKLQLIVGEATPRIPAKRHMLLREATPRASAMLRTFLQEATPHASAMLQMFLREATPRASAMLRMLLQEATPRASAMLRMFLPHAATRAPAMPRMFVPHTAQRAEAMPRMFVLPSAPADAQPLRASALAPGERGIRTLWSTLRTGAVAPDARPSRTIVARQPDFRPHSQQHRLHTARHIATFERATHQRLATREFRRVLVGLPPASAASGMTFQTALVQLAVNAAPRLGRYGEALPLAASLAYRQQPQTRPADMKREIERIERTVQTKVVREILHQGHQQQQIRTAVSDALLSSKIMQTLARQIHATLEQRANVERYRKGSR